MNILIEYNGRAVLATVVSEYKVVLTGLDHDELTGIDLDQCKECGAWKSEDEELYGDGLCTNCCVMCDTCQQYKRTAQMMDFKTIDCNQCVSCNQIHKYTNINAPVAEVGRGDVKVVLEYIGEGFQGDFTNDGIDKPLMRMSVAKKQPCEDGRDHPDWDWVDVDNSSYCTQIIVDVDEMLMNNFCKIVVDKVYDDVKAGNSIKKMCEEFSWANEAWIKKYK